MSSKESNLKEKFRIALNSTAKVISDDFNLNKKNLEEKKAKDIISLEIDNLTNPGDFIRLRAETDSSALKKKFSNELIYKTKIDYGLLDAKKNMKVLDAIFMSIKKKKWIKI